MGAPEPPGAPRGRPGKPDPSAPVVQPPRYGRYVVILVLAILVGVTINTIATKPHGAGGIAAGERVPPFAVPLASGNLKGDANVSTTGKAPACTVRGPEIMNICQLYERGPVAVALFLDAGGCGDVLGDLQGLSSSYPKVQIAAVAMRADRGSVRKLVASHGISFPVGIDDQGDLAALYRVATCPQVTFVERGGTAQGRALLGRPSRATLRTRLAELEAAAGGSG